VLNPTDEAVARLEVELAVARQLQRDEQPQRAIEAAERAVAKAEQQLVWAREALAQAIAENGAV
jgi:hypothetical protein